LKAAAQTVEAAASTKAATICAAQGIAAGQVPALATAATATTPEAHWREYARLKQQDARAASAYWKQHLKPLDF
jgi:hypothetical protein